MASKRAAWRKSMTDWIGMGVLGMFGPEPMRRPAELALVKTDWHPDLLILGQHYRCEECHAATVSLPGFTANESAMREHLRHNHGCTLEYIAEAVRLAREAA